MEHLGNRGTVTLNIDDLVAGDGVSFARAFAQNPVSTPSRCSFMTGWYFHVRGHRTMHYMLQPDEPMLLRILKEHGYFVWWGGKNDLVPAEGGFTDYCDVRYVPKEPVEPFWQPEPEEGWREGNRYYSFLRGRIGQADKGERYHDPDWAAVEGASDLIRHTPADRPFAIFLALVYPHPPYAVEEP